MRLLLPYVAFALGVSEQREPIAMVTDEHGGVAGLVTLEDLTETVLGVKIVDESHRVIDLRRAAAELRERRLARMLLRRRSDVDADPAPEDPSG